MNKQPPKSGLYRISAKSLNYFRGEDYPYRLLTKRKLVLAGIVLLYALSPFDLAPELLLGPLGLSDDVLAAIYGLRGIFLPPTKPNN